MYEGYQASPRVQRKWSAHNRGNQAIRAELEQAIVELCGKRLDNGDVLDVGCGSGWWLQRLAMHGVASERLHGVDLLEARAAAAADALPGADLRVGDARMLPYPDARFAVVMMLTLLSSMSDATAVAAALGESQRVLATNGILIVYEPRIPNPFNPATRRITLHELAEGLGAPVQSRSLTLAPALARRLGRGTPRLYPGLARIPALRTHRLAWWVRS